MDETYQVYLNRVTRLTLPATYQSQLATIQPSPKFAGDRAVSFPGYSISTPVGATDRDNAALYTSLSSAQKEVQAHLEPELIVPVPPASFHLTLADLIWDRAYHAALETRPEFESLLCDCIARSFKRYRQNVGTPAALPLQVLGFVIRPRSLAVALAPQQDAAYTRLLHLRRALYQNPDLIGLGIEQQYPYTAHITLGYFSRVPLSLDVERLTRRLVELNDAHWLDSEQVFWAREAQLQRFTDMTHFIREPVFPAVAL